MSKFVSLVLLWLTLPVSVFRCAEDLSAQEGARVEAVGADGASRSGRLRASGEQCRIEFENGNERLDRFAVLKNPVRTWMLPRGNLIHRIELVTSEVIHARLLRLDANSLQVEPRWADTLSIPRRAVRSVSHGSEGLPLLYEGFEDALGSTWKIDPRPEFDIRAGHSGKRGLRLDLPKEAVFSPPVLLPAGSLQFWLRLPESPKPLAGGFDLLFQDGDRKRTHEVRWGAKGFAVASPISADITGTLPPTPGWHLFQLEWAEGKLLILMDDRVLLSAKPKDAGALQRIVFLRGDFDLDDLILFEPRDGLAPARLDPNQDELLRRGEDQLVGRVESLDEEGVGFLFRKSKRRLPWTEVRSLSFASEKFAPKSLSGQKVGVSLASRDASRDTIEGVLRAATEKGLTIDHAILGPLSIPPDAWRELNPR
jgi:hypothetical protein